MSKRISALLNEDEAAVLRTLCSFVKGNPLGPRGVIEALDKEIAEAFPAAKPIDSAIETLSTCVLFADDTMEQFAARRKV